MVQATTIISRNNDKDNKEYDLTGITIEQVAGILSVVEDNKLASEKEGAPDEYSTLIGLPPPAYEVSEAAAQDERARHESQSCGNKKLDKRPENSKWFDVCSKVKRVCENVGKFLALLGLLFFFICSLDLLSSAFRLLGGKLAGEAFSSNSLLSNPIAGLVIGIMATVLVQSSSTSTSIIITMVASGIIEVPIAIPIIMGANIGTSVTNTIVSMAQSGDKEVFRRAFAGATVHDMFNWMSVIILLPLEAATGYLNLLTGYMVESLNLASGNTTVHNQDMLKKLTKPVTGLIIKLDKHVIEEIALGNELYMNKTLIKRECAADDDLVMNVTMANGTGYGSVEAYEPCKFLFNYFGLSDKWSGLILLAFSLTLLCGCLVLMVKLLKSILKGQITAVIDRITSQKSESERANQTKCQKFKTGLLMYLSDYLAMLVGAGMTVLVQSSSVFTSALTPLVGLGVVSLEKMYPLTLGSNIGTTATGLLAAMAASGDKLEASVQIALVHLFFNLSGIALFFPIPQSRIPIRLANIMGNTTAKYRWFPLFYLIIMFFVAPGTIMGLSMAGVLPMCVVLIPICLIATIAIIINVIQNRWPEKLPAKLRTWDFLPFEFMHSLDPLDRVIMKIINLFRKCCPCCCKKINKEADEQIEQELQIEIVQHEPNAASPMISEQNNSENSWQSNSIFNDTQTQLNNTNTEPKIKDEDIQNIHIDEGYVSCMPTRQNSPSSSSKNTPAVTPAPSRCPSTLNMNNTKL